MSGILLKSCCCEEATEACCFSNGACADLSPADCIAQGGTPQGPATECAAGLCAFPGDCAGYGLPPCGTPDSVAVVGLYDYESCFGPCPGDATVRLATLQGVLPQTGNCTGYSGQLDLTWEMCVSGDTFGPQPQAASISCSEFSPPSTAFCPDWPGGPRFQLFVNMPANGLFAVRAAGGGPAGGYSPNENAGFFFGTVSGCCPWSFDVAGSSAALGLGDLVSRAIKIMTLGMAGECEGCGERRAGLNRLGRRFGLG